MKSSFFLTLFTLLFSVTFAFAQVPQAINYQAVIRTDSGLVVPNKSVNVRLSVQDGLTTPPQYIELHTVTTNQFGLVTLSIGKGAASTGVFSQINWGIGEKFLKTEVDLNRTGSYTLIGVQQFLSVPYALYAERAGNVSATNDGWKVSGNAATTGQFLGTTNAQDLKIFTNNLQRAVLAADGSLGIGVNFPAALLHTNGSLRFAGLIRDDAKNNLLAMDNVGNVGWRDASSFAGSSGWLLNGNTATSTNFLGTNNAQDLRFNTNSTQKMVITTNGNVGIGTRTPTHRLRVETNSDETGSDDRVQMQLHNRSNNNEALAGLGISSGNTGTNTWLEHVGANYNVYSAAYTDFNDLGYLASTGRNGLMMMSYSDNAKMRFAVGTANNIPVTRMSLSTVGLGLGTIEPTAQLHNVGTARFEGLSINNAGSRVVVADASGNLALRDVSTLGTGGGGGTGWLLTGNTTTASNYIGTNNSDDLRFNTEGSQKMVVKTNGFVGMGTNTPDSRLTVEGNADGTSAVEDRIFFTLKNTSTSPNATVVQFLKAGDSGAFTMLAHNASSYRVVNNAQDYGQLWNSGRGLIIRASPASNSPGANFKGNIRFYTGHNPTDILDNYLSYERMRIEENGNIGIGTITPKAKLEVATGDVYVSDQTKGIILKSPNGNCWRVTIDNTGNFVRTAISCPQ